MGVGGSLSLPYTPGLVKTYCVTIVVAKLVSSNIEELGLSRM